MTLLYIQQQVYIQPILDIICFYQSACIPQLLHHNTPEKTKINDIAENYG